MTDENATCPRCAAVSEKIEALLIDYSKRIQDSLKETAGKPDFHCGGLLRASATLVELVQACDLEPGELTDELLSQCDPVEDEG